jgi:1-acyl-sn-glycerol-3-phosphate acyltransferase
MSKVLRGAFFLLFVRPVLTLMLGTHVRGRENLPKTGPAIIVANHNSHLDTMTIMAMFPMRFLPKLRPVAAMDYFMRTGLMAWFATNIIGIIPIVRGGHAAGANPLAPCEDALDRGEILIIFPEGSRGEPEKLQQFKKGVAHLAKARPGTPVHPLFMHGLGKALPKDSVFIVPFNCDVIAGEPFYGSDSIEAFMDNLQTRMTALAAEIHTVPWD